MVIDYYVNICQSSIKIDGNQFYEKNELNNRHLKYKEL